MAAVASAALVRYFRGGGTSLMSVGGGVPDNLNWSNSLILVGVVTVLVAVAGMFHYKDEQRRRKDEHDFVVKTLAPGAAAVMLVLFFAFGRATTTGGSEEMSLLSGGKVDNGPAGISVPVFSTLCVVALGVGVELVRRNACPGLLEILRGRRNRSSSQTLHPVRIRSGSGKKA